MGIVAATMLPEDAAWARRTFSRMFEARSAAPNPSPERRGGFSARSFVAEDEGRVVGITGHYSDPQGGFWLGWFAVAPDCQRQGMGSALLEKIESLVREQGGRRLWVWTSPLPLFAQGRAFYEARGFRLVEREPFPRVEEETIVLVKEL